MCQLRSERVKERRVTEVRLNVYASIVNVEERVNKNKSIVKKKVIKYG